MIATLPIQEEPEVQEVHRVGDTKRPVVEDFVRTFLLCARKVSH